MSTKCIATYNSICINADGSLEPCCQYLGDRKELIYYTDFKKYQDIIQQQMHNDSEAGIRHTGCKKCWTEEDSGWPSLRHHYNARYKDIGNITVSPTNPIYHIELRLGNYCNLNCLMCSGYSSSSIAAERSANRNKFNNIKINSNSPILLHYWETKEFWAFTDQLIKDVRHVNITGGEPFIIPEVVVFLQRLLPKKDSVQIAFNTNLTKLPSKLITVLQQFKKVIISISLEGINDKNDYVRYPSKWENLCNNLELVKFKISQAWLSINHTFQHSSVYALPDLAKFCHDNNLYMHLTTVQGEPCLTLDSVPINDLNKFKDWAMSSTYLDDNQRQLIINSINSARYSADLHKKYYDYVTLLDEIRGTNYYSVFDTETKYIDN